MAIEINGTQYDTIELTEDNVQFFHFTETKFLEDIFNYGLLPRIGENSTGVENTAKIFFSSGIEGVAKCIDVWVRWRMVEYHKINTLPQIVNEQFEKYDFKPANPAKLTSEENLRSKMIVKAGYKEFTKFIAEGKGDTPDARVYAYEEMFSSWQNRTYLALDLNDMHFHELLPAEDKARQFYGNSTKLDKDYLKYMYGNFEYDSARMEKWNMHTFPNKGVESSNIKGVISADGKIDGLSVAKKICSLAKSRNPDLVLPELEGWLKYCSRREREIENANIKAEEKQLVEKRIIEKGNTEISYFGTEKDGELVQEFLLAGKESVSKIRKMVEKGANPNVPVSIIKKGPKFVFSPSDENEIVSEQTMPALAHFAMLANVEPIEKIKFVHDCMDRGIGAKMWSIGNRYVLPANCLEGIEDEQFKDYLRTTNQAALNAPKGNEMADVTASIKEDILKPLEKGNALENKNFQQN